MKVPTLVSDSSIPLLKIVFIFLVIFVAGTGLTIPLYNFDYRKFFRSRLFIKIMFWIPIFLVFIGTLYAAKWFQLALLAAIMVAAFTEIYRVVIKKKSYIVALTLYFLLFAAGLAHFYLLGTSYRAKFINILVTLCFATVLSDVTAFFFGNYLGEHKLPQYLNDNKSWEGVFGQLVGALLGVLLVNTFVLPVISIWLFLPLGLGSAMGDLANSYAKRKVGIKDWSTAIPGHGGFIDRFSSMAGSVTLMFYFLKITSVI